MSERLQEVADWRSSPVNREAGVIPHVKVLGFESRNNRTYAPDAVKKAINLYEGRGVNLDHRKADERVGDRKVTDHFGELRNCVVESDGLYADLHFLKTHKEADTICERADRMPNQLGLSHDAEGQTKPVGDGGRKSVESIDDVVSVDVVRYPATTSGLFESISREEPVMTATTPLREVNGDVIPVATPVDVVAAEMGGEQAAVPSPEMAAKEAFAAEVMAIVQAEGSLEEIRAALMALLEPPNENTDNEGGEEEMSEPPAQESAPVQSGSLQETVNRLQKRIDVQEAIAESRLDVSYLDPERRQLLEAQPDKGAMVKLIESWPPYMRQGRLHGMVRPKVSRTTNYDQLRKQLIPAAK